MRKQESDIAGYIAERNAMEEGFGEGKRKYRLGLIQARLKQTSEIVISLQFIIMNIQKMLRDSFFLELGSKHMIPLQFKL